MIMRKFAYILVILSLILGQAYASTNFESKAGINGDSAEFGITSLLTRDGGCAQDNCACSESDCTDGFMLDCAYAAGSGSARCAPGVFGTLIFNQSLMAPELGGSIPISHQIPIYYDISLGITPRPPKPVV
jgi:hypothetical protein